MNGVQIFNNEEFGRVRAVERDGEPWFVAKDVAEILEYPSPSTMYRRLDGDEKMSAKIAGISKTNPVVTLINESGLYNAIIGSKKPEAKKFKKWVTSEVLPSIRAHGAYATPATLEKMISDPDFAIGLLQSLKDEQSKRKSLEEKVEKQRPKVVFADSVAASKGTILVRELAIILRQNGVQIGQNRLFEWLREKGYLVKRVGTDRNTPTQRSLEQGLMKLEERTVLSGGNSFIVKTPRITGKGQKYFVNKLLDELAKEEAAIMHQEIGGQDECSFGRQ